MPYSPCVTLCQQLFVDKRNTVIIQEGTLQGSELSEKYKGFLGWLSVLSLYIYYQSLNSHLSGDLFM